MTDYTPNEIVDMMMALGACNGNFVHAAALYSERFPERRHPTDVTISNLTARAWMGQLHRQRAHREYGLDDFHVLVILALVHLNPHYSCRQIERDSGIPRNTVSRILRNQKYHAYHITLTQELSSQDFLARLQFCQWALQRIQQDPNFFNFVIFSDEATFTQDGMLNLHNCHYWSDVNPHWYRPIEQQHRWSVMVWCGIVNGYLVGPYFFNGNVNRHSFLELLTNHLPELLENVDLYTRQKMWIQLDGAPPHYAVIAGKKKNYVHSAKKRSLNDIVNNYKIANNIRKNQKTLILDSSKPSQEDSDRPSSSRGVFIENLPKSTSLQKEVPRVVVTRLPLQNVTYNCPTSTRAISSLNCNDTLSSSQDSPWRFDDEDVLSSENMYDIFEDNLFGDLPEDLRQNESLSRQRSTERRDVEESQSYHVQEQLEEIDSFGDNHDSHTDNQDHHPQGYRQPVDVHGDSSGGVLYDFLQNYERYKSKSKRFKRRVMENSTSNLSYHIRDARDKVIQQLKKRNE